MFRTSLPTLVNVKSLSPIETMFLGTARRRIGILVRLKFLFLICQVSSSTWALFTIFRTSLSSFFIPLFLPLLPLTRVLSLFRYKTGIQRKIEVVGMFRDVIAEQNTVRSALL